MSAQTALVLARALHFSAAAVLWGGGGLSCFLRPLPASSLRLLRGAGVVAAVAGVAWLAITLVIVTDDPGSLLDPEDWLAFWSSAFGTPWGLRLAILAGCLALALRPPRAAVWGFTMLGGALAIDQAWLGHAATGAGQSGALMIAADALHVLAAYAWTGALPMLGLTLRAPQSPLASRALDLFGTLGLAAVAAILGTGLVNAGFRITAATQLIATPYGRIVALKLLLFVTMLLLAWSNRRRAAAGSPRALRRGVALETGIGVAVLCAAALLGVTRPPG